MFNLKKPYIIAEIGSSHMGSMSLAFKAIEEAKKGGADCVKFQLFNESTIVHPKLKTLSYIKHNNYKYQLQRFAKMKISLDKLKTLHPLIDADVFHYITYQAAVSAKSIEGGTAPSSVKKQISKINRRITWKKR